MTKYLMSRANYQRLLDGGGDPAELEKMIDVYPDEWPPEPFAADQDRIAARYTQLLAEAPKKTPVEDGPARTMEIRARRNGKASTVMPEPWEKIGPNVWAAPTGTPMPEPREPDWASLEDSIVDPSQVDDTARRYFLNTTTTGSSWSDAAAEPLTLEQLQEFIRQWYAVPWAAPRRRIKAGRDAAAVFAMRAMLRRPHGWPKNPTAAAGALADLTGIPIVPDDDLPPNVWQLVDHQTGEVLYEGTAGDELPEYRRVARENAIAVAEEAGIPPDLLL